MEHLMAATTTGPRVKMICECGGSVQVAALSATDRHDDRSVVLQLCEACRESRTRTWRLHYEPEDGS